MNGREDERLFQSLAEISASVYGYLSKNEHSPSLSLNIHEMGVAVCNACNALIRWLVNIYERAWLCGLR